jgi:hypothetical protein
MCLREGYAARAHCRLLSSLTLVGGAPAGAVLEKLFVSSDAGVRAAAAETCNHGIFGGATTAALGKLLADVQWAGLIGPGLYQLNVQVPSVAAGDHPVMISAGGFQGAAGVFITVGGR